MTRGLLPRRLSSHGLARPAFRKPEEAVAWFGAVQAQDYFGALWGIGQRVRHGTEADVEAAEARRAIVRTWPMRGTLHFVAAADARWMTGLLAPRVIARHAARWRRDFEIDDTRIQRADDVVTRALEGGQRLTREALYAALESRRLATGGSRGLHLLLVLAMRGRLCLAGRVGKQHSFALLDEWLPASPKLDRDAALVELATRYFTSHGPATERDLAWWAGLTLADARLAIDGARRGLERETIDGETFWWRPTRRAGDSPLASPHVRLLPAYDEYAVAYRDRAPLLEPRSRLDARGMGLLGPSMLIDGRVIGTWARTLEGRRVNVALKPARRITRDENAALRDGVAAYGRFLDREATMSARA
jgi:hypothetical protein